MVCRAAIFMAATLIGKMHGSHFELAQNGCHSVMTKMMPTY